MSTSMSSSSTLDEFLDCSVGCLTVRLNYSRGHCWVLCIPMHIETEVLCLDSGFGRRSIWKAKVFEKEQTVLLRWDSQFNFSSLASPGAWLGDIGECLSRRI
ncbi:hypothetical protein MAP00_007923 [Monascus purpureus]|nr:hypothetical protein MAP00_007923 [Monascus purpureus]